MPCKGCKQRGVCPHRLTFRSKDSEEAETWRFCAECWPRVHELVSRAKAIHQENGVDPDEAVHLTVQMKVYEHLISGLGGGCA